MVNKYLTRIAFKADRDVRADHFLDWQKKNPQKMFPVKGEHMQTYDKRKIPPVHQNMHHAPLNTSMSKQVNMLGNTKALMGKAIGTIKK